MEKAVSNDDQFETTCKKTDCDDEINEACYCLKCRWQGYESELSEQDGEMFARCPKCGSTDIVFI